RLKNRNSRTEEMFPKRFGTDAGVLAPAPRKRKRGAQKKHAGAAASTPPERGPCLAGNAARADCDSRWNALRQPNALSIRTFRRLVTLWQSVVIQLTRAV